MAQQPFPINDALVRLYLKSLEGTNCFQPKVNSIDDLKQNGYVKITTCNEDKNSDHGAKTCKIQVAWLTEHGKKIAAETLQQTLEMKMQQLKARLEQMNPRSAIFAKYLLLKWAIWCLEKPRKNVGDWPTYLRMHLKGDMFVWDFVIPPYRVSKTDFLPITVKNDINNTKTALEEFGLASKEDTHNTKGWGESSGLVTVKSVAVKIVDEYGGEELPWPIDLLIHGIYKAFSEKEMAFHLDYSNLWERDLSEHLKNASQNELGEFLFLLHPKFNEYRHDVESGPIKWNRIRRLTLPYFSPGEEKEITEPLARRFLGGKEFENLFHYRLEAILYKVSNAISEWIETGKITLETDIPEWRKLWELTNVFPYHDNVIKELREYYDKIKSH